MKKIKLSKSLITSICSSVCLFGASAGIIFGISAGSFKIRYLSLEEESIQARINSASTHGYYDQDISSQWNMMKQLNPGKQNIEKADWDALHSTQGTVQLPNKTKRGGTIDWGPDWGAAEEISPEQAKNRWSYASMVIDGSTHATLDRSFNQSLYNGIVNFIQNKDIPTTELGAESTIMPGTVKGNYTAASYKPAEDNNKGLANTYKAVAANNFRMLGLAGFNHLSPLKILGAPDEEGTGIFKFYDEFINLKDMNMLLIDGDCDGNQNVASAVFRSDQPGFLTGVSTCMYFMNNLHTYHKGFKNLAIGAYGGNPIPTVTIYMGGVQRGIEFFNKFVLKDGILGKDGAAVLAGASMESKPDFKKIFDHSKDKDEIQKFIDGQQSKFASAEDVLKALYEEYNVKMLKLGDFATHFTGSFASGDAIGITKQYLNRGASAIIAVAGPQSLDSAQEIQNQKSDCIVIGVDSAMEDGQYQRTFGKQEYSDVTTAEDGSKPAQKENIIKFSAVKDMTTVTRKFLELCKDNKYFDVEDPNNPGQPDPNKAICNVGYKTCGNIQNGLISISFDGWHPLVQALKHVTWGTDRTFAQAWSDAATTYFKEHTGLSADLKDITKIDTYSKEVDGVKTLAYANYGHIMAILGVLLNDANNKLNFKKMTVVYDPVSKTYKEDTVTDHSVLEWLKNNMYFTC